MLTENELQCLIGLLYSVAGPEGISVEVGSRVLDTSSGTQRDVDVTIRYARDGSEAGLAGVEVKDHTRALDITHVEQLAAKLGDMPSLTSRAVVSASGFTDPARRKAQAHGLELLHFRPWDPTRHSLNAIMFPKELPFQFLEPRWAEGPVVQVYSLPQLDQKDFADLFDAPVSMPGAENVTLRKVLDRCAQVVSKQRLDQQLLAPPQHVPVDVPVTPVHLEPQPMTMLIGGRTVTLLGVTIRGRLEWASRSLVSTYYMLQKEGQDEPQFGCVITEMPAIGSLIAFVPSARGLMMVTIGPEQRARRPFKLRL